MKNKTRFSAGNLVSQGPRALSTYGVGRMRRLGRVPDALSQIDRLTRHDFRWPLNFPNLIISLARFGQVPEGQLASPWLNLPAHQTSNYRDTANLGLGVRRGPLRL